MSLSHAAAPIDYAPAEASRAEVGCVWTLTVDGRVEHTTASPSVWRASHADTPGLRPWRAYWPDETHAAINRAIATAAAGEVARFRLLGRGASAQPIYWETVVTPVRAFNGAIVSLVATSRDVTGEVERESLLDTVVHLLPSPVIVKDVARGLYILWNQAAEAWTRVSADAVLWRAAPDALSPQLRSALAEAETAALVTGERQVRAFAGPDDGRMYDIQVQATFDDCGARHLITLCTDVSERHAEAAAAQRASDAKSLFLANMSHELRTPMNGIIAGVEMLSREALSDRGRELVEIVKGSGANLERLLTGIIDLASIEAGGTALQIAPFHLGDLVRQCAGLAQLQGLDKGVEVRIDLAPEAEASVAGDALRLSQVLTNLLANAVKFTDRGSVEIVVARRDAQQVSFRVTDTGVGFDAAAQGRIFDRFQQADSSVTRRFGGSGLGLAIAKELVALMGGQLDCESTPGQGSCFWFTADLPPEAAAGREPTAASGVDLPQRRLRILVADDHPTNRRVLELLLAEAGEVVSVADGQAAVAAALSQPFDLVLMDIQMPVMDGLTAVRCLRRLEREQGLPRTPIAMVSSNVAPDHLDASAAAGADRHLGKPLSAPALFATLAELFQ